MIVKRTGRAMLPVVLVLFAVCVGYAASETRSPQFVTGEWTNPNGARADGGDSAFTPIPGRLLEATVFDFSIPTSATIEGVEVRVDAWHEFVVTDYLKVILLLPGGSMSMTRVIGQPLTPIETTYIVGNPTDDFGLLLSPGAVNHTGFGVRVYANEVITEAHVDYIEVTVHYTEAVDAPSTPDLLAADDTGVLDDDNVTYLTTLRFSGTAEAGDLIQLSCDGVPIGSPDTATGGVWELEATVTEGTHSITATAEDGFGNVSAPSGALEVIVDRTPPTISIGAPSATDTNVGPVTYTVTYGGADTVSLNADDIQLYKTGTANGSVNVSGSGTTTRTITVSGITGDGTLAVFVIRAGTGIDVAGLLSEEVFGSPFTVDNTAPTDPALSSSSHTVDVWSANSSVVIGASGAHDGAGSGVDGFEISWEWSDTWGVRNWVKEHEETWTGTTIPSADGVLYFHIATVDNAGNWSSGTCYGPFRIDTTAPTNPALACTTHTVEVWSSENELEFVGFDSADDTVSGVSEFYMWWISDKGAVFVEAPIPGAATKVQFSVSPDGVWYLDCETSDAAGNAPVPLHFGPFKIDTTGPEIGGIPSDQALTIDYGSDAGTVFWEEPTATDAGCGLAALRATHASGDMFAIGTTTVTYTATDTLGNTTTAAFDVVVTEGERPLSLRIEPAGEAGSFLYRCLELEDGEEPPMVGLYPLAAIYEVGELVTGACSICDAAGSVMRGSYVHLYIYTVDIEPRPETRTLLDHWTVHYDRDAGGYTYSWDTTDIAPGYCDLYLSFADGSSHTCRIELTAPVE